MTSQDTHIAGYPRQLASHLELRRVLGEGGSSIVFEAFHTRLKVPVAVKLLSVRGSIAEQARLRLLQEAELYAQLDDPRIPRVYDVDELADGTPYVVMEFVPGGSLESLLTQGALSSRRAVMIAQEVLAALAYVHARGVLHRDVKPANVIMSEAEGKCSVRLVDFGIAKVCNEANGMDDGLTAQGTLVGTPHYMAPERVLGEESDERGDVYAVGVMLYEMLSGHTPFIGSTLGEVIASVLRDVPPPLHEICAHVPAALGRVIVRALERAPSARYGSAQDMLLALKNIESTLQGEISSPRIVPPFRSSPPSRSYSSLDVHDDDLFPQRRRMRAHWPLALVAGFGAVVWFAWPAVVREQEAPPTLDALQATSQPAVTGTATAAEPMAAPTAALPESAPALAATPLEAADIADTEVDGLGAQGALEGEDEAVARRAAAELGQGHVPASAATSGHATPAPQRARPMRDEEEHESGSYESPYQPVRSVPLQPVLDNIDRLLRQSAPAPDSATQRLPASPPVSAPAVRPSTPPRTAAGVPDNPY